MSIHVRVKKLIIVASILFGGVHGGIRISEQGFGINPIGRVALQSGSREPPFP
jgi:hypothetical protein